MPLPRQAALLGLLFVTPVAAGVACSSDPASDTIDTSAYIGQSIMGGQDDQDDSAVVGIVILQNGGMCSGTLIAPNLVLTARHCVAQTGEQVSCTSSSFGSTFGANSFYITTEWNGPEVAFQTYQLNGNWFQADKIMVSPESDVCGNDIALIRLEGAGVPTSVTAPIVPRVDEMVANNEPYIAIGFGTTSDTGGGSGRRRILEDLFIKCVGNCPAYAVNNEREWEGDHGICQGDSGGPALDLQRRVIGVVSRGGAKCTVPVYGSVYAWADWIRQNALEAAQAGGYEPAAWVTGGTTEPEPEPDAGVGGAAGEGGAAGAGGGTAGGNAGAAGGTAGGPSLGQLGDLCDYASACESALCVFENNLVQYCSQPCSAANPTCPAGFECATDTGACFMNGGFGKTCQAGSDCRSGICVRDSSGDYCSQLCASDAECPQPATCAEDKGACFLPPAAAPKDTTSASGGCSVAGPLSDDPTKPIPWAIGVGLLGLGLASRRRQTSHR